MGPVVEMRGVTREMEKGEPTGRESRPLNWLRMIALAVVHMLEASIVHVEALLLTTDSE